MVIGFSFYKVKEDRRDMNAKGYNKYKINALIISALIFCSVTSVKSPLGKPFGEVCAGLAHGDEQFLVSALAHSHGLFRHVQNETGAFGCKLGKE